MNTSSCVGTCGRVRKISDWLFVSPALLCGFGHALLFPAVVSIGAGKFPVHYRGSGTTLVLGMWPRRRAVPT